MADVAALSIAPEPVQDPLMPDLRPTLRLALGCMEFGGRADAAESGRIFGAAFAAGIRHFDTAHLYTGGASEQILGKLIAARRQRVTIASKIGYSGGAGASTLRSQFELSRHRLGVDCIDLLYLHRFDPNTPLEETLECFAALQAAGMIRWIGLSNFAAWQVMKAQAIAQRLGTRIDAIQPMYSLVKRQAEVELLPMAQDQGITAFTYSPLAAGLLTGKYLAQGGTGRLSEDPRYAARYGLPTMHQTAADFYALASELQIPPATLAVAWAMAHAAAPVPLISGRSLAQILPSLEAARLALPAELYLRITALSTQPAPATDRLEEA